MASINGSAQESEDHSLVTNVERRIEELFSLAEIDQYLQTPFSSLSQINRAGVRRRDFIDFKIIDLKTGSEIDPFAVEEKKMEEEIQKQNNIMES